MSSKETWNLRDKRGNRASSIFMEKDTISKSPKIEETCVLSILDAELQ